MRLLTRYILREVSGYALLGGVLFTFVLFMRYLLALLELLVRGAGSATDAIAVVAYLLPSLLTLTIPMAVLVGVLLGLSRLASDSEITAMRACGMSVFDFVRAIGILAIGTWLVGLGNTLYVAPHAAAALLRFEAAQRTTEASFAVQSRVFYEDFRNYVLYVQDVQPAQGASIWQHVFLADMTQPATPHIITAKQAEVFNQGPNTVRMHLSDGARHDLTEAHPDEYDIYTFSSTDLPVAAGHEDDTHLSRHDTPMQAIGTRDLLRLRRTSPHPRAYAIEWQRRLAYPAACLVLVLIGVPLGLSSKRGGKSTGFVATFALVFLYYFASSVGIALAQSGKLSPFLGVWGANLLFTFAGFGLLRAMSSGSIGLGWVSALGTGISKALSRWRADGEHEAGPVPTQTMQRLRRTLHSRFPLILDEYVMRSFVRNFLLVLMSLAGLFLIFTFFELIGDIIRFRTPLVTVGEYLLNLVPFILYNVTPVCSLVAVLITFGALSRTSELTAMKANGISLYRIVTPVLVVAAVLAVSLFAFDEVYLPGANRRQEALRSVIKGKPAQTFLRPDRKWMSGQASRKGEPQRIFYYQFFDPDKNVFANLTIFEFQPGSFVLTRRVFAETAHWDDQSQRWILENGWERDFQGETVTSFKPFSVTTLPFFREQPAYFKKEDRPSQEMSYGELARYIGDLRSSGFDTMRLRVQLNRKIAYPLITFIMAVLAIPFAVSAGKRGSLAGMGAALGVAIVYWVVAGVFENLGNVNSLPPVLAAWSPDLLFGMAGAWLLLRTPT